MDYLLARWYIVSSLPPGRLKSLHSFERAVKAYGVNNRRALAAQRILPPLWWQEGALFLRVEFKKFWAEARQNPAALAGFKDRLAVVLDAPFTQSLGRGAFSDIDLMHRCDLAVNTRLHI